MPKGMRLLVCLDEYERLESAIRAGWGARVLDALRHWLQHHSRIVLMFTGARTFQELGPVWTDRFISARRVKVSFLTLEESLPLFTKPIPNFDMTYATGVLDLLYLQTNGQPFLMQAVAFELTQLLNERKCKEASINHIEESISRALVSGGEYFANLWAELSNEEQTVLQALASSKPVVADPLIINHLREKDILNSNGDFAVPIVKAWVRKNIGSTDN